MTTTTHTYRPTSVAAAPPAVTWSLFPVTYSLNFAFSAKERDVETGLSYFGARYYSSDLSVWLAVDPMSDKYPSLSPYVYCADNPVGLVDPNGEEVLPNMYHKSKTKKFMKQFFRKEFGTSNMFRFDITGKLIVRNSKYNDFLKTANNDQKMLLKGLHDAIESSTIYNVRISSDGTDKMKVRARIPNGKYDSNGYPDSDLMEYDLPVGKLGGGATTKIERERCSTFLIGVDVSIARKTFLSTGQFSMEGTIVDEPYPIFTGSASATFFHELLDEGLNDNIQYNPKAATLDKVQFQNAALRNENKPERDGQDH